jgi:hypothetical protein
MDEFAKPSAILELDNSSYFCEQSIVASYPNVQAWLKFRATLPNENRAAIH